MRIYILIYLYLRSSAPSCQTFYGRSSWEAQPRVAVTILNIDIYSLDFTNARPFCGHRSAAYRALQNPREETRNLNLWMEEFLQSLFQEKTLATKHQPFPSPLFDPRYLWLTSPASFRLFIQGRNSSRQSLVFPPGNSKPPLMRDAALILSSPANLLSPFPLSLSSHSRTHSLQTLRRYKTFLARFSAGPG